MPITHEVQIGTVPVDSGTISIGDPCYLIENKGSRRQIFWEDVVNEFYDNGRDRPGIDGTSAHEINGQLMTNTPDGDGRFPVYAEVDERGQIQSLRIDLNDEPEMCDGCDWSVDECTCGTREEDDEDGE